MDAGTAIPGWAPGWSAAAADRGRGLWPGAAADPVAGCWTSPTRCCAPVVCRGTQRSSPPPTDVRHSSHKNAPTIDCHPWDSGRRPPESPVAAPSLVGGDHVTRPAALVRHETRMRCPTKRVFRTSCRNGAGDVAWPQSGSIAAGFVPITSPSLQFTAVHFGTPASSGGDRSRRHRLPGRFPVRHGLVVPDVLRCHAARSGRAAAVMLGRPDDRTGVSQGSLTIASNSACSHSSSSQINAQKSASTAPEPSAAPVFSRPSMRLTP